MYPYSLVYLSNYLLKNGYSAEIIDLNMTSETELIEICKKEHPEVIGLTGVTVNRFSVIDLAKELRNIVPKALIVVGGKHFSFVAEETIEKIPEIDVVVRGEGEITLLEIVKAVESKRTFNDILGITYREKGKIVNNPDRPTELNIDKFSIDYDFLPKGYSNTLLMRNYEKERIKSVPILLGRGCSQRCVFCTHNKIRYRVRSLESIIEEIEYYIKKFNCRYFSFNDPSFCERKKFVRRFCQALIDRRLDIKWYCEARADTPHELLQLMHEAGCISLDVALESGSERVLKAIRKRTDPLMVLDFVKECKRLRIRAGVFTMISLPDEKSEDALKTLKLVEELSDYAYNVMCSVTQILPGTELYEIVEQRRLLPEDFSWTNRDYQNGLPSDFGPANIPMYVEHLDEEFIQWYLDEFKNLKITLYNSPRELFLRWLKKFKNSPIKTCKISAKQAYSLAKHVFRRKFKTKYTY